MNFPKKIAHFDVSLWTYSKQNQNKAAFSFENIFDFNIVAFLFLFDKLLSNHKLTRLKRFISWFTDKLCN